MNGYVRRLTRRTYKLCGSKILFVVQILSFFFPEFYLRSFSFFVYVPASTYHKPPSHTVHNVTPSPLGDEWLCPASNPPDIQVFLRVLRDFVVQYFSFFFHAFYLCRFPFSCMSLPPHILNHLLIAYHPHYGLPFT